MGAYTILPSFPFNRAEPDLLRDSDRTQFETGQKATVAQIAVRA
jgi:hypothetical protein